MQLISTSLVNISKQATINYREKCLSPICGLDLILDYTISAHMTLMVSVGTKTIAVSLEFYFL